MRTRIPLSSLLIVAIPAIVGVILMLSGKRPNAFWNSQDTTPAHEPSGAVSLGKSPADDQESPAQVAPVAESESKLRQNLPRLDPTEIESAIRNFREWSRNYAAANGAEEKQSLITEGYGLAARHRQAIKQLIPEDPRHALEQAVPMVVRQQLPAEILSQLEERISTRGLYRVIAVWPSDSEPPIRRIVEMDGKRYQAHVYGRRLTQPTTEQAFLSGIAVDKLLALDERLLRVLEPGEIPDATKPIVETCPVSGKSTAVPKTGDTLPPIVGETPAVEAGGAIHYLCSGGHIVEFEEQLIAREGGTGGPIAPSNPTTSTSSTGVKSCLYLRLAFPESRLEPQTEAAAYDMMRQVNDWFVEVSYGNLYLLTTVAPLIVLPRTEAFYTGGDGDEYSLFSDALVTAAAMGYDYRSYNLYVVAYMGGPGNFNGAASVGSPGVWLKRIDGGIAVHELGHNLGLRHANFWNTGGRSVIGDGIHIEYGNSFDIMGSANAGNLHFNAAYKSQLNWLKKELVHEIRQSGPYRIYAYDQPQLDPADRYALKVRKDSTRFYWGEFRQAFGASNPWLRDGLLLNWSPWVKSDGGTHLLDTTPGTPGGATDAALTIGRTFSDFDSGIHITPVGKGGTSPESIDVVVNLGKFPGNQSPAATTSANQVNVGLNTLVNFTVTATDPEADTLAYFWDFGDQSFSNANSPEVSKAWNAAGEYVVRCLVSDMKGGTASDSVIVRVGSPVTFTIRGRITLSDQPLANVHVFNSQSGAAYRGGYTDSDGQFTITGFNEGSVTLGALLDGYSLTAVFSNPVTVGPSFTGANFTAAVTPQVTVMATDPDATEGTDAARFTIARTGSTANALAVALLAPVGTAWRGEDYTLSPEAVYNVSKMWFEFTIPAGQAMLEINLTAVEDESSEGPETVRLEVLPTASYALAGSESATIIIQDADTILPLVEIQALDAEASEAGNKATFVISRSGSTGSPLTVGFTTFGTATNGTDYADIGNSVIIPAGQPSVNVVIAPLQDIAIEGTENVLLTLSHNANYLPAFSADSASASIVDDEVPTLTISATDAAASETDRDPATFVISRSGDTSAPLTVDYALSGSAHHGVDYAVLPGVLTIPAGSSASSITVIPIDDEIGEPVQTVAIQIRGGTRYVVGSPWNATASIVDNDVPVVTIGVVDGSAGEPSDAGYFKFTTSGSAGGNITVRYTVTGSATPGVDYMALSGNISMGRNTTATVAVTPLADGDLEDLETITVTIDPDPAYTSFLDKTATLNLLDNGRNTVYVTASDTYFDESNGGAMNFHISRQGPTTSALDVYYAISGTASNGVDYVDYFTSVALSGIATIPAGQAGVEIYANMIDDSLLEGTETATLTLTPSAAYSVGIASATQYIPDNEVPLTTVRFGNSAGSGNEAVGTVSIPVTLNAASASIVTVEYAVAGGSATGGIDYTFAKGALTFNPGVTSMHVPLTIIDDTFVEPAQTVIIALENAWRAGLGTSTYTYTINDNDSPPLATVGFAAPASTVSENISSANLPVSLSAAQLVPITVHYAPVGGTAIGGEVDYTLTAGTLTFAPGDTVKFIPMTITDDTINESNETVVVALNNPSGALLTANTAHTLTISNTAPAVRIRQITATSEGVVLELVGIPGLVYAVERSLDLKSWTAIAVLTAPTNGRLEFVDPPPLPHASFYRMATR